MIDLLAVPLEDDVAGAQAGARARASRLDLGDERAGAVGQAELLGELGGDRHDHRAEPAARDLAVVAERVEHLADAVDRDRERQLAGAIAGRDRDADDLARGVEHGPPELPRWMRASVWMNVRKLIAAARSSEPGGLAAGRRDDAGRGGDLVAERIAEHDQPLADLEVVGVAERQRREPRHVDRRAARDRGGCRGRRACAGDLAAVGQHDAQLGRRRRRCDRW